MCVYIYTYTHTQTHPTNGHIKVMATQKRRMGINNTLFLLFIIFIFQPKLIQGIGKGGWISQSSQPQREPSLQNGDKEGWKMRNGRRLMIGSTAPSCTYNECRGCKYKCRAEQVPVEGNDPINSPFHYRCVCHRP